LEQDTLLRIVVKLDLPKRCRGRFLEVRPDVARPVRDLVNAHVERSSGGAFLWPIRLRRGLHHDLSDTPELQNGTRKNRKAIGGTKELAAGAFFAFFGVDPSSISLPRFSPTLAFAYGFFKAKGMA
jgi:hypothetical protein